MDIREIALGIGIIIGAIVSPFVRIILGLINGKGQKTPEQYITVKDFSEEKDKIYNDMDDKIEKATRDLATKESVTNISCLFSKFENKFDLKIDEFSKILQDVLIKVEVMTERRKEKRD